MNKLAIDIMLFTCYSLDETGGTQVHSVPPCVVATTLPFPFLVVTTDLLGFLRGFEDRTGKELSH